jgi:hypothetical protein
MQMSEVAERYVLAFNAGSSAQVRALRDSSGVALYER